MASETGAGGASETEATLAVVCSDPRDVLARIGAVERLGAYRLSGGSSRDLYDRYLDTPRGDLRRKGFAFRIRDVEGVRLLTLKGPTRVDDSGVQQRFEMELEGSEDAAARMLDVLRSEGVLPEVEIALRDLKLVQARRTRRVLREAGGADGAAVGELALDTVTYPVRGGSVIHCEIEVEAVGAGTAEQVAELARELLRAFPALRMWPWSKLATGSVLGEIRNEGALPTREDGTVPPEAYGEIEARLRRGSFRAVRGAGR